MNPGYTETTRREKSLPAIPRLPTVPVMSGDHRKHKFLEVIRRYPWAVATAVLILGFVCITKPVWSGRAHAVFDAYQFFAPYFALVANLIQGGEVMLWNPWSNGGMPDFAEPQIGASSPVTLLFAAVLGPSQWAFGIYWLAIWLLGGIGMLCLSRHWLLPAWAGLVGALAFIFSGVFFGHAQHTSVIYSMAFLPFVIWRLEVALEKNCVLAAIQAGAIWGLSAIGGNPTITIAETLLIGLWGLAGPALHPAKISFIKRIRCLGLIALTGCVVMSPVYFGFLYEGKGFSFRSETLGFDVAATTNLLHPEALSTLFSPNIVILQGINGLWPQTDMTSTCAYVGGCIMLLFVVGCFQTRGKHWVFVAAMVLFFLFSFGACTPFYHWLYTLFPPIRFSRQAAMLRGMAMFILIAFAMWTTARMITGGNKRLWPTRAAVAFSILALIAIGVTWGIFAAVENKGTLFTESMVHTILIWGGLGVIAWLGTSERARVKWIFASLAVMALLDAGLTAHLNQFFWHGNDNLNRGKKFSVIPDYTRRVSFNRNHKDYNSELLYYGGASLSNYTAFKNSYHEALAKDALTARFALTSNRIWFSREMPAVPISKDSLQQYTARVTELNGQPVLIRHTRDSLLTTKKGAELTNTEIATLPAAQLAQTEVIDYRPNFLKLRVQVPEDGWLCVTERWARSWHCQVNGKPTPVEGANFIFRATPVQKGVNEIEYRFEPGYFYPLLFASWGVLLIVGAISLLQWRKTVKPTQALT